MALFSWLTNVGTLAIILLMALTAFSIVAFFGRNPALEGNKLVTAVLPVVTGLILAALVVYIATNFGALAGAEGALAVLLPGLVLIAAALGHLTPVQGALIQEAIDVAVILNALRALRISPTEASGQAPTIGSQALSQGVQ